MTAEIVQFLPKPNPTREKLIDQARKDYESIFPGCPAEIANVALIGEPLEPYLGPEEDGA